MIMLISIMTSIVYLFIFVISVMVVINPKWCWQKYQGWGEFEKTPKEYFEEMKVKIILSGILVGFIIALPTLIYIL